MSRARVEGLVYIVGLLAFGAVLVLGLSVAGYISTAAVGKYGIWVIIGLLALYLISQTTRNAWDNMISLFMLLLAIGGIGATYLVDQGYVTSGAALIGSLLLVFIMLLVFYAKQPLTRKR